MKNEKLTVDFQQLSDVMHVSNENALEVFLEEAKKQGISDSAPYPAVLKSFIDWKRRVMNGKSLQAKNKYITDLSEAVEEDNKRNAVQAN